MENLQKRAAQYVAENLKDIISETLKRVYEDGYRDGFYDCKDHEDIELDGLDFIDLGLPSGTLWSSDYLYNGEEIEYLPYLDAEKLSIPTEEQWRELIANCVLQHLSSNLGYECTKCVGTNGKVIILKGVGYEDFSSHHKGEEGYPRFWLKKETEDKNKYAINIYYAGNTGKYVVDTQQLFMGYHLPIRLVKSK